MSSAGATSLATVLWEHGLPLSLLQLDQNLIGSDGAMMLSKALHRCRQLQRLSLSFNPIGDVGLYYLVRSTMNSHRKMRSSLPRPEELYFTDHGDDGGDFHSDDEDSDSDLSTGSGSEGCGDEDDAFTSAHALFKSIRKKYPDMSVDQFLNYLTANARKFELFYGQGNGT